MQISAAPRLDGQIALITGACGAIGGATAALFADAGATVVATDIVGPSRPFADPGTMYRRYDVRSRSETDALVGELIAAHGRIDVLVLCAGVVSGTPLETVTDEEWDAIDSANVRGVLNPLRAIYPHMVAQKYGKIVALGSIAAKIGGFTAGPAYVAAKSAVHGIVKWVAKNGARHGVYANVVAPGPVETPMFESVAAGNKPSAAATIPLGRYGVPADIAQAILFLASPQSHWITGAVLDVNGGMLMD